VPGGFRNLIINGTGRPGGRAARLLLSEERTTAERETWTSRFRPYPTCPPCSDHNQRMASRCCEMTFACHRIPHSIMLITRTLRASATLNCDSVAGMVRLFIRARTLFPPSALGAETISLRNAISPVAKSSNRRSVRQKGPGRLLPKKGNPDATTPRKPLALSPCIFNEI